MPIVFWDNSNSTQRLGLSHIAFFDVFFFKKKHCSSIFCKIVCILYKKIAMNEDKQFRLLLAVSSVVWLVLVGFLIII